MPGFRCTEYRKQFTGYKRTTQLCGAVFRHGGAAGAACLAQQIHYLDITGEIDIFRKCHALDEEARQQNVLILPGAGTDIVPTDCLAAMLKEKLPVATRIDLALSFGTNPSIGTVNTMIESFGKGGLIREGGMLKVVSNAFQMRKIPFQNKPQWAMTIPWGDVFTSGISTGVPDGAVYMAMPRMSIYMIRLTNPVKGILNTQFGQKITKRLAGWLMKKGPDAKALEAGRGQFWGEAEAPDGEKLEMTMSTPNVYALTATVGIRIAQYCLDYTGPGGYYTPSMLLGSRFIESIPGIEVHVLNQRLRKI